MQVDLIIQAKWFIPIVPRGQVLEDQAIIIKNKKIHDLCSIHDSESLFQAKQVIKLPDHAVIPGLVNAHGHSPMALLRGVADDIPLKEWLEDEMVENGFLSNKEMDYIHYVDRFGEATALLDHLSK